MMMNKTILYIGNDFAKTSNYKSTMETLSLLLKKEGFLVYKTSEKQNKIFRLLDMCFTIIKTHRKVEYALIDTFSTSSFYFAFVSSLLLRLFNVKYIPILHGGNLPFRLDKSRKISKIIFNNSYKNIAPSNYLKAEFKTRGFHTVFIPNILEIESCIFKERKTLEAKILWVRAFRELYNPQMAIEVLHHLKKKYSDAKLCMIGPVKDDSFKKVKTLVRKLKLENDVEFTGILSQDEWHEKSKDFDIFINTTQIDNTPVSLIETMALGLPIVSTNVGGLPYLIDDKIDGLLVEANNAITMSEAIGSLIDGKYNKITESARKKAKSFSWDNVKRNWFSILK